MKLSEAVELFYRVIKPVIAVSTAKSYHNAIHKNFLPYMLETYGDLPLEEISRSHIRAYRDYSLKAQPGRSGSHRHSPLLQSPEATARKRKGLLSLWTVHQRMRAVKRLFNWLVSEGILEARMSPVLGVEPVRVGNSAAAAIPTENIVKMVAVALRPPVLGLHKARDLAITALMGAPGPAGSSWAAGSGELSRLRLGDLDPGPPGCLTLTGFTFSNQPVPVVFRVEMSELQHQALKRWLALRPPEFASDYIFTTLDDRAGQGSGQGMSQKAVYSAFLKERGLTSAQRETRQRQIALDTKNAARRLALLLFFIDTGCRLGGALSLTYDRLDLAAQRAIVFEKGRGGQKIRTVFFSSKTAMALKAWLDLDDGKRKTIFGSSPQYVRIMLRNMAEEAGLGDVACNPHAFRHSFAKLAIQEGANLAHVQRFLGHSSITTTSNYYIHWDIAELQKVHEKVSPVANLPLAGKWDNDY